VLDSAQIRAARALLGWRQDDLARHSGLGLATIQRIENADRKTSTNRSTMMRLKETLEQAGIQFIARGEGGGIGVRLTTTGRAKKRKVMRE
jgi:transcriptional regulator with XRE-family HTH domain